MGKKERIALWDNLKFVLVILVVLGHMVDLRTADWRLCRAAYLFLYAFHMPLFLFVSGLFYRPGRVRQKILFYVLLGFTLKAVVCLSEGLLAGRWSFVLLGGDGIPWYLFVLAIYTGLMAFLEGADRRVVFVLGAVLACLCGLDSSIGDGLYLSRTVVFFPFYFAGTALDGRQILRLRQRHPWVRVLGGLVLVAWAVLALGWTDRLYAVRPFLTGRNPFPEGKPALSILVRALCMILSFGTGAALVLVMPGRRLPLITDGGAHSLEVYFWHWSVILLLSSLLPGLTQGSGGLWKAAILLLPVLITLVLSRGGIFSFPGRQIREAVYGRPGNRQSGR